MKYKYPPVYKYGLLLLTIYMFLKHQKILTSEKILINSVLIILIFFIFDNIIIDQHPNLLEDNKNINTDESIDIYDEFDNNFDDDNDFEENRDDVGSGLRPTSKNT